MDLRMHCAESEGADRELHQRLLIGTIYVFIAVFV